MKFNRPEAKRRAKASTRGVSPHPAVVTLVFVLLTTVLTYVIMLFVSNPFEIASLYLMEGNYAPELIIRTILTPGRIAMYIILNVLINLYVMVMNFGYTSYGLRLSRWERPGFRNLFDGFALLGRVIGMNILIVIFTSLWSLLAMVPYIVLILLSSVSIVMGQFVLGGVLSVIAIVALIAGIIFGLSVSYRYRLAPYFLLDHPREMKVLECIRQSKLTMKGRKWSLFVQDLSFLGWLILTALTLGILGLWVWPYMEASQANFYNWAVYGRFPEPPAASAQNAGPNV